MSRRYHIDPYAHLKLIAPYDLGRPDLGDYEIKAQLHHTIDPNKHSNFLVIKPNSPNHLVHILVLVHSNTRYEVAGFRRAGDAKFERYEAQVGNRPMFYRVPADELDSIGLLDG